MAEKRHLTTDEIHLNVTKNWHGSSHSKRHAVKCFRHCSKFVFCFEIPDCCPVCDRSLLTSEIIVPPFVYQSPLEHDQTSNPAILVRPSQGKSFLHDYGNGDDLHCGILDENGKMHSSYY